jgi:hypothetical protein
MVTGSPPLLSLNAVDPDTGELIGQPFIMAGSGESKIAVIALTGAIDGSGDRGDSPSKGHHKDSAAKTSPSVDEKTAGRRVKAIDPIEALEKHLPALTDQSDLIILLSALSPAQNKEIAERFPEVNVILGIRSDEGSGLSGTTFVAANESEDGKKLGKLSLTVDEEGSLLKTGIEWLPIRKTYAEDQEIRKILDKFYDEVAGNEEFWEEVEPLFTSFEIEADSSNKYVGASKCGLCHEKIYAGWKKTKHAVAYTTLVDANRYFYPDCINCHTTGAGYPSGFRIDQTTRHLEGVQCEVCHGPGGRHLATEGEFDLRLTTDKDFCGECHDADVSPELGIHFEEMLTQVDHSDVPADIRTHKEKAPDKTANIQILRTLKKTDPVLFERLYEELAAACRSSHLLFECNGKAAVEKRRYLESLLEDDRDFDSLMAKMVQKYGESIRSTEKERARYQLKQQSVVEALRTAIEDKGKAKLELFVISYGKHGIKAENLLFELKDEMPAGVIELKLHFIAKEADDASDKSTMDSDQFTSHNGQREIDEDIRQILMQHYYPNKLRNYLLLRNASITTTDWKECARIAGIDPGEIEMKIATGEGAALLKKDIHLVKSRGITRSPTLLINGEKFLGKFVR